MPFWKRKTGKNGRVETVDKPVDKQVRTHSQVDALWHQQRVLREAVAELKHEWELHKKAHHAADMRASRAIQAAGGADHSPQLLRPGESYRGRL